MTYTAEQIQSIKLLAELFFIPSQILLMISMEGIDLETFKYDCLHNSDSPVYRAYQSGKLEQEMLLRKAVFVAAKQGSPVAKKMADKIIVDAKYKEKYG